LVYVIFVALVLSVSNLTAFAILSGVFLMAMIVLPYRKLKTGAIPISLFLLTTFAGNVLFNKGEIIATVGPLIITKEGLSLAVLRTLRVFCLIAGAKFLTVMITIEEMIGAFSSLLSPLQRIRIPVKDFFDIMALSVAALPLIIKRLSDEYKTQLNDSTAKGVKARAAIVFRFLLPVFFESIHNPGSIFGEGPNHQGKR
jgi:energy-coupling factor transport system permease protein